MPPTPSPRSAIWPRRPASGASTCSPGATSTTSRPAGPRSTSRRWPSCGPPPGVDVTMRTSWAQGQPTETVRDGYKVIRRAGRHMVFPRAAMAEILGRTGPRDVLVEIWNGMPFLSPIWNRGPRVILLHHVHAEMWNMTLGDTLGPDRGHVRGQGRPTALPQLGDRHAVRVVEARARRRAGLPRRPGHGRPPRHRPQVLAGRRAQPRPDDRRRRPPRPRQALRRPRPRRAITHAPACPASASSSWATATRSRGSRPSSTSSTPATG